MNIPCLLRTRAWTISLRASATGRKAACRVSVTFTCMTTDHKRHNLYLLSVFMMADFLEGIFCPIPDQAMGDDQCKVHTCQADGSCNANHDEYLVEGSPCLSCMTATVNGETEDCIGSPPCKCSAMGTCIPSKYIFLSPHRHAP